MYCLDHLADIDHIMYCPDHLADIDHIMYCLDHLADIDHLMYCLDHLADIDHIMYCLDHPFVHLHKSRDNYRYHYRCLTPQNVHRLCAKVCL